jgi:tetratricopeptide (TPR) repeat protein
VIRALTLSAILVAPSLARGECPVPVAMGDGAGRASYRAGERFYASGRYQEAAAAFTSALDVSGRAELYFDLANAYERMGDRVRSAELLERYLECARPPDADLVEERARRLRRPLAPLTAEVCPAEEEPAAAAALPAQVVASARRAVAVESRRVARPSRLARVAPWLIGGTAALAAGALLFAAASDGPCQARPCSEAALPLEGTAAVSLAAGAASLAVGVVVAW